MGGGGGGGGGEIRTMRIQTSVGNRINLRHEIKFENRVKNKNNFLIKKDISFAKTKIYLFYS